MVRGRVEVLLTREALARHILAAREQGLVDGVLFPRAARRPPHLGAAVVGAPDVVQDFVVVLEGRLDHGHIEALLLVLVGTEDGAPTLVRDNLAASLHPIKPHFGRLLAESVLAADVDMVEARGTVVRVVLR